MEEIVFEMKLEGKAISAPATATPSTGWWGGGTPSTWRERKTIFTGCGGDSIYRVVGRGHSIYVEREKNYLFRVWWGLHLEGGGERGTPSTWSERNYIFTLCGGDSICMEIEKL
jgi:hypothetical protein